MNPGWRGNYLRYRSYFLNVIARYRERADVKAYIEILLSLATISIFAIFALRPTLLTIAGLMKEIESKRQTLDQMQTKIEKLTSAKTLYDREMTRITLLNNSIPESPDPEVFARQIEGLSENYDSKVLGISVGEAVIVGKGAPPANKKSKNLKPLPEGVKELSVSATYMSGLDRYSALANIISGFENLQRPAKIDSIRINTASDEDKTKVLELSIEARLPYSGNSNK